MVRTLIFTFRWNIFRNNLNSNTIALLGTCTTFLHKCSEIVSDKLKAKSSYQEDPDIQTQMNTEWIVNMSP